MTHELVRFSSIQKIGTRSSFRAKVVKFFINMRIIGVFVIRHAKYLALKEKINIWYWMLVLNLNLNKKYKEYLWRIEHFVSIVECIIIIWWLVIVLQTVESSDSFSFIPFIVQLGTLKRWIVFLSLSCHSLILFNSYYLLPWHSPAHHLRLSAIFLLLVDGFLIMFKYCLILLHFWIDW